MFLMRGGINVINTGVYILAFPPPLGGGKTISLREGNETILWGTCAKNKGKHKKKG